jgi:hypothetical protein
MPTPKIIKGHFDRGFSSSPMSNASFMVAPHLFAAFVANPTCVSPTRPNTSNTSITP